MRDSLPLHDGDALRTLERQAAHALGGDAFEPMRRAGQAAWRALLQHWPDAQRIVVACGPGNNGGDGYVLARHARESGRDVRVVRLVDHAPRGPLAQRACADFQAQRGPIHAFEGSLPEADVLVDALFGIGLSRAPDAASSALIDAMNAARRPLLSLDVPSGVDSNTGHVAGTAVRATRTLQFMAQHAGLRTGDALDHVGALSLASLELPQAAWDGIHPSALLVVPDALERALPPRPRNTHKGRHGHVLCIGGDTGMGGAIALCAQAALRSGAGLVTVATRGAHAPPLLARLPEAMSATVDDGAIDPSVLARADVLALGPGSGRSDWGHARFDEAMACGKPCVIDADALFHLAASQRMPARDAVLTPHPGEAARLLGDAAEALRYDRFAMVDALARRYGCTVVLKGAGTLVAMPGETTRVIAAGNPGMAVGGMGDVLTGVVAALRAQGMDAFDSASFGALLHAHAGDLAARDGERGLLPGDVVACLRTAANPSSPA